MRSSMAGSTEIRRIVAALLVLVLTSACATGKLVNAGRRVDRAVRFESAYTDGDRLWLVYRAERLDVEGERLGTTVDRAAVLRIADLDPERLHPVDAFPVEHVKPSRVPSTDLHVVALVREDRMVEVPSLSLASVEGVDVGFLADRLPGAAPGSYLRATALDRQGVAPWVIPILPLALAWDAVAVPALVILAVPTFMGAE